jgi:predicted ATPase/class 3 adenylate cyclase
VNSSGWRGTRDALHVASAVTTPVLDLEGRVVNRRLELAQLQAAVEESGRSGGGYALLGGVSGVGKSTLMQAFGVEVSRRDCLFAYGRYQDGAPAPYSALGDALGSIVRTMEATGPAERDRWRADLVREMSAVAGSLDELVPDLAKVLGPATRGADLDAADARRRLQRAAIRLVSTAASYRPVVLAIDDLQWADRDSLLLLSELLTVSIRNVLVLGAHRAGEFDPNSAGFPLERLRRIDLSPLSRDDLEELLAAVCGRAVELGDVAAEFHHRTGGNPLQVRQLLYRAQREGALTAVGAGGRPTWDLRVLTSIEISATTAEFLERYLDQLRPTDRTVLSSLACIGGEFDLADATAAAAQPTDLVAQALWSGLELRLIEAVDSRGQRITNTISREARYRFSHDRVAEAARADLSDDDQRDVHLRIARRLVEQGDDRLFEAARHVGIGGHDLVDDNERIRFVEVLRHAAQKARAQASFPLTLEWCLNGLQLLGEQRWAAHFPLTRELQLDAAEAALLVGDVAVLHTLLDEAEENLNEPADRARLAFLRLKGQVAQGRLQEALETGLRALDELGEPLPREAGKPRMANSLVRMRLTTRRWTTERLLQLPQCEDRRVVEIQRILGEIRSMSYIVRPNLFPLIVRKMLDLTLANGHTPSSPVVLASYGLLLVLTGDRAGSQRFGEVGMLLTERAEFREARPETVFLYLDFIRHWREPLRDGLGQLRDAVTEALDQGNQEYAGFLAAVLLSQSFCVGRPLAEIDALAESLIPQIRSQPVPRTICQAMQQLCLNLMGRSEDPFLIAGESGYDEREVVPAARREGDEVTLSVAANVKLGLHFWAGDYAGAVGVADEAFEHISGSAGHPVLHIVHLTNTMSRMQVAPGDRATRQSVRTAIALHRKWAEGAPGNYAAPCALLEGAWARVRGQHSKAAQFLDRAIALAEEHQLPLMAALAYEEAATLYAETGRTTLSEQMLRSAYERWLNLGMALRTERLALEHPWLVGRDLMQAGSAEIDPVGAHHLVRALPAARSLDDLAKILLGAVSETTGAVRALLLTGEGEQLTVRAVFERGETTTVEWPWTEVSQDRSIVARVVDSGRPLVVAADSDGLATLAVPIRVQDKTIGVVYAEHHDADAAFTPADEDAVTFLCDQAAAPLWNFELEARLRAADEHRQSLMDVQSRFVPNELLRILDIDDLRRVRTGYRVERPMTVLISDIRGYTALLEDMNVSDASNLAMGFLRAVEVPIITCNGMIQDVRGDEILAIFESGPDSAVRAGLGMLRSLREHNRERLEHGSEELRVGIGINHGVVGLGLVGGVNRMVLSIIGDAVNLAARIESTNKRYGSALLISDATYAQLTQPHQFDIRRMERVMVVNRRQPVTIYEVYNEDPEPLRAAKQSAQPAFDEAFALFDSGDVDQARTAFERCRRLLPDDPIAAMHLAHCDAIARGEMSPGQEFALQQKYTD